MTGASAILAQYGPRLRRPPRPEARRIVEADDRLHLPSYHPPLSPGREAAAAVCASKMSTATSSSTSPPASPSFPPATPS